MCFGMWLKVCTGLCCWVYLDVSWHVAQYVPGGGGGGVLGILAWVAPGGMSWCVHPRSMPWSVPGVYLVMKLGSYLGVCLGVCLVHTQD